MLRRYRTVENLKARECARALRIEDPFLASRLTAMGLLPGTLIEMIRRAPFGHTYYIKADGIRLALRKEEAQSILVDA
jgi:ferrous iron transport protein A